MSLMRKSISDTVNEKNKTNSREPETTLWCDKHPYPLLGFNEEIKKHNKLLHSLQEDFVFYPAGRGWYLRLQLWFKRRTLRTLDGAWRFLSFLQKSQRAKLPGARSGVVGSGVRRPLPRRSECAVHAFAVSLLSLLRCPHPRWDTNSSCKCVNFYGIEKSHSLIFVVLTLLPLRGNRWLLSV